MATFIGKTVYSFEGDERIVCKDARVIPSMGGFHWGHVCEKSLRLAERLLYETIGMVVPPSLVRLFCEEVIYSLDDCWYLTSDDIWDWYEYAFTHRTPLLDQVETCQGS